MNAFVETLHERTLVLDGGLGTLLEARGNDLSSALWSARLLIDDPDEIRAAHTEFVAAGADVLITASYQVGYEANDDPAEVDVLLRRSVDLARQAGSLFVAASVGPYGAVRADGSEYTGDYGLDAAELRRWHHRRLGVLADAGADVLAIETVPSLAEVEAICTELDGLGIPAWISLSAASTGFDRASVATAMAAAADGEGVVAVGVNCCPPGDVLPALAAAPAGIARVAYPNSGERWDAQARAWVGDGGVPTELANEWVAAGARLVGGCCRTTPADITALAAALSSR